MTTDYCIPFRYVANIPQNLKTQVLCLVKPLAFASEVSVVTFGVVPPQELSLVPATAAQLTVGPP